MLWSVLACPPASQLPSPKPSSRHGPGFSKAEQQCRHTVALAVESSSKVSSFCRRRRDGPKSRPRRNRDLLIRLPVSDCHHSRAGLDEGWLPLLARYPGYGNNPRRSGHRGQPQGAALVAVARISIHLKLGKGLTYSFNRSSDLRYRLGCCPELLESWVGCEGAASNGAGQLLLE